MTDEQRDLFQKLAQMLGKDSRNIGTFYSRAVKKYLKSK